jgi:hypothetical protein
VQDRKPSKSETKVQVEQGVALLFDQILSSSMKRPERMIIKQETQTPANVSRHLKDRTLVWGIPHVAARQTLIDRKQLQEEDASCMTKDSREQCRTPLSPCTSRFLRHHSTFHTLSFRHELPSIAQKGIRTFLTIRSARGRELLTR